MRGELTWGIRESLLGYIDFLPDGTVTLSEDVGRSSDGPFTFHSQDIVYEHQSCTGTFKFHGRVSLAGHGGMLSADLEQPWIEVSHAQANLSGLLAGRREELVKFVLDTPHSEDGRLVWASPTYLTKAGASWLGGHYAEGEEMDPLRLVAAAPDPN
jgi:hypothetical protein